MRYRLLAFGYLLSLGPLITASAADPPLDTEESKLATRECDDGTYKNYVIANLLEGLFKPIHTACQLDMAGTTARRNVAATVKPPDLQSVSFAGYEPAKPPTLAASVAVSKAVAPQSRRYERRFAGVLGGRAWK